MSEWTGLLHAIFRGEAEKHWRITEGLLEMGLGVLCCDFMRVLSQCWRTLLPDETVPLLSPLPYPGASLSPPCPNTSACLTAGSLDQGTDPTWNGPVKTRWLILTQLSSPVWFTLQLPRCASTQEGGRRTLPLLCQHGLTLAKALASPQLKELRPALQQPLSVQSLLNEENLAGAAQCAREGLTGMGGLSSMVVWSQLRRWSLSLSQPYPVNIH